MKSDIHFDTGNTIQLVSIGLVGGLVSGAFGLGGGSIFGPVLLHLHVAPKVVSATSMYMIMYSTVSSSLMYIIVGTLDIGYGFWISFYSVIGTIIGMKILDTIMKKFQRQSPIVIILVFLLMSASIMVPLFGSFEIKNNRDNGEDIWEFKSFC